MIWLICDSLPFYAHVHASVPTKPIFFSEMGDLLEQGEIAFSHIVNVALENLTNLWKFDIWYTLILDWYKI